MSENNHIPIDRRFAQPFAKELEDPEQLTWLCSEFDRYSLGWSDLLSRTRTVVLGEAKCGKTHEFKQQVENLRRQGKFAFFLPLERLDHHDIRDVLFSDEAEDLEAWLETSEIEAWFFLDAVDELKLRDGSFKVALGKLHSEIGQKAEFAHIFVSCRPADWNNHLDTRAIEGHFPIQKVRTRIRPTAPEERGFVNLIQQNSSVPMEFFDETEDDDLTQDKKINVLVLLPLTREQTLEFATLYDAEKVKVLEEEIEKWDSWQMFQSPADIIDGFAQITNIGQLGSLQDQISSGIDRKLQDHPDKESSLSLEEVRFGAQRLALAMCLMKRQSLALRALPSNNGQLLVAEILTDWPTAKQNKLLRLGIFDSSGINAVRFHHRTTQEFLAAKRLERLKSKGLSIREIKQLLFCEKFGERMVVPSMEAIASWLALWNDDVFAEIKIRKPQLLFRQGLPASMLIARRKELLRSFVTSFQGDDWRRVSIDRGDVARLGHIDLSPTVGELWSTAYEGHDTRELLLKLIWVTPLNPCAHFALKAAFDVDLPIHHRIFACRAVLAAGTEEQKKILCRSILDNKWPDELVCWIIPDLYPLNLDVNELVTLATKTEETPNSVHGLGYALYSLIGCEKLSIKQVRKLRTTLSETIWESREANNGTIQFRSIYSHFTDAILAGCARDVELVSSEESTEWAQSAAIVWHFGDVSRSIITRKDEESIRNRLRDNVHLREAYFWATFYLIEQLKPDSEAFSLYIHLNSHDSLLGPMTEADLPFLFRALEDTSRQNRRPIAFYFLMQVWRGTGDIEIADSVRTRISDLPKLIEVFETYMNPAPQHYQHDSNDKYLVKKQKKKRKWDVWCEKVKNDPELMLGEDKREKTIRKLCKWLNRNMGIGNSGCHWDANLIQETFSEEFLQLVRPVLAELWRQSKPKLWSERAADRRNYYPISWRQALTALASEADNSDWVCTLTVDEAKLATRIAMLEVNGFESYLPDIEKVHSDAVQEVMIGELSFQLSTMVENEECPLIRYLKFSGTNRIKRVAAIFIAERLGKWPNLMNRNTRYALKFSTELIHEFGSNNAIDIASSHIKSRLDDSMSDEDITAWLQALALFDVGTVCQYILKITAELEDETKLSRAVKIFGFVFGDRHDSARRRNFSSLSDEERIELLFELVCRVYEVAPPSTDIHHESTYTPNVRDLAKEAREYLFALLVNSESDKTYRALNKFAEMENFSHMEDRLRQIATEVAAKQCEPEPMPTGVFRKLDQEINLIPTDNQSIHNTMLNRLEDYFHFVEESEYSNKRTLQLVEEEIELRRNIANWLNDKSLGAYTVHQEAVVNDENRTDIRLTSSYTDIESVIEIKLDDKKYRWSASKLLKALKCQLVGNYLSHERCQSGCLLICLRESRRWQNPDSKILMNLNETVEWLQGIADEISQENPNLLIAVRGLDLSD